MGLLRLGLLGGLGSGLRLGLGGLLQRLDLPPGHRRSSPRRPHATGDHRAAHAERRLLVAERIDETVLAPRAATPPADRASRFVRVLPTAVHVTLLRYLEQSPIGAPGISVGWPIS